MYEFNFYGFPQVNAYSPKSSLPMSISECPGEGELGDEAVVRDEFGYCSIRISRRFCAQTKNPERSDIFQTDLI